jgi:phage baseplate assembly protein W
MANEKYIHPLDAEDSIGIGLDLPLTVSKNTFFQLTYTAADQAHANLKNLVLTNKGERVMLPTFGCDIKKMVFEQEPEERIIENIKTAIEIWLPYINVIDIIVERDSINEHQINVNLNYNVLQDEDTTNELILEISTS